MEENKIELETSTQNQVEEIHPDLLDNEFAQLVQDLLEKRII